MTSFSRFPGEKKRQESARAPAMQAKLLRMRGTSVDLRMQSTGKDLFPGVFAPSRRKRRSKNVEELFKICYWSQ